MGREMRQDGRGELAGVVVAAGEDVEQWQAGGFDDLLDFIVAGLATRLGVRGFVELDRDQRP